MNWLTKAILYWGNTINTSLGYEIYTETVDLILCEDCYLPEKSKDMFSAQFIADVVCNGCRCSLSSK